jgi:hypothetical protein
VEDYAALSELAVEAASEAQGEPAAMHLGVGAEIKSRPSNRPPGDGRVFPAEITSSRRIERDFQGAAAMEARPALATEPEAEPERDSRETERRESIVPKGTFTSDATPAVAATELADVPPAGALSAPREAAPKETTARVATRTDTARSDTGRDTGRIATASSSQSRKVRTGGAPPYLASAILREDMTPSEPGKRVLNQSLLACGLLGAAAVLVAGAHTAPAMVFGPLFLALLALARIEMSYAARAMSVAVISGAGLGIASLWRVALGSGVEGAVLTVSTTLLSAALLLRAWFRGSNAARGFVAMALVLALSWAFMTSHRGLLELGFAWSSWLPALAWYVFVLLCLLSLLAFMGDETTGGCEGWAIGLFLWFGGFAMVRYALNGLEGPAAPEARAVLGLVEPAVAAPTAIALAQLGARALGLRSGGRRVEQALTS